VIALLDTRNPEYVEEAKRGVFAYLVLDTGTGDSNRRKGS
jgi:hypothetical protein